eukprot:comp5595_c0_seq1/m.1503 comp5595_c0_seq1/g.1503  ORF comp5595_c0_seq1/g.1503 comp5595_c0_seq1/m.1503 type:complete len:283 (-) comp5595_c0_seq1:131-979(-)
MSEDREISQMVWDGIVPIVFTLASNEVTSEEPPAPYYVLAQRCSYLTLVTDAVQRHFTNSISIPDCDDEIWFEYEGIPLKWHWPIGVLFDLYGNPNKLPWPITVHFQCYPEDEILHCQSKEVVEAHLTSCIKEADCLRNGSAKRTLEFQPKHWKQLWEGLRKGRYESYWEINKKLMARDDNQSIKNIPFRLYVKNQNVQRDPFSPLHVDGRQKTLGDMLCELRPDLFPPGSTSPNATEQPKAKLLIHGVNASYDTPVLWMSDNLSHPDNFLHIILHPFNPME